jgi:preprotein translocase subunit SecG
VENVLLLGQVVVSFALMASILLQTRGAGLGATFGGDSSVYRSRRGIEKRLFQFTVVLAVLFVIFSMIAFKLGETGTTIPAA